MSRTACRNDVEVIEQPLGGGRQRLAAPGILCQCGVDHTQDAGVVGELHEVSPAAAAPAPGERQQGGQASCVFLERLDAQQLNAGSGRADGRRFTHSSDRTLRTLRSKP